VSEFIAPSQDITVEELRHRLEGGQTIHILDVREPYEYEEFNIGGKLVPLGSLLPNLEELEGWKSEEVVVHCKAGTRSAAARALMMQHGFSNVRNLVGGMQAWKLSA
jgi:rhodanese-related sulfurtransferase